MTDTPMSDDARAERQWALAAQRSLIRYVLPGWWPLAVSGLLAIASWVLVGYAAAALSFPWPWAVGCWVAGLLIGQAIAIAAARRKHHANQEKTVRERVDQTRADYARLSAKPAYSFLKSRQFWQLTFGLTGVPKTALGAYALHHMGLPFAIAIPLASLTLIWLFVSRIIPNKRLDPAMNMILAERGPDGLPTPEV